jgi:hypothetical protein
MSNLLTAFNDHFFDFINDVHRVFPENVDILMSKNALSTIRKLNPKMILKIWKTCITAKYKHQILANDISFFLTKDYSADVETSQNSDKIMESIDRLRGPITHMSEEEQVKVMKYIQNLTKLSELCDSNVF